MLCLFFFFNDTATTEIYTLSLHDALPICVKPSLLLFDVAPLLDLADDRGVGTRAADPYFFQSLDQRGFIVAGRRLCEMLRRSEEHTSELQSQSNLVCRLLLEKKKHTDSV